MKIVKDTSLYGSLDITNGLSVNDNVNFYNISETSTGYVLFYDNVTGSITFNALSSAVESVNNFTGVYKPVDDVSALYDIPSGDRKENLLVNTKSPYKWWQLIGGTDNSAWVQTNISLLQELTDITLYIATSGSDTTGDGTVGTPYATLSRAIEDIPLKVSNLSITFIFNEAGTYTFGDNEKAALGAIAYSEVDIFFLGVTTTIESAVSFTETAANTMTYNATKAGVTLTENEWKGYFLSDSGKYYPIPYNSAGTDNFVVEYMRGARSGTRDVVDMGVILDISSTIDSKFLEFNFSGLPKITFEALQISHPTQRLEFTTLEAFYDITFGTKIICDDIILGQFSEHTISNLNFTGCYIDTASTSTAISTRNAMGNYNFTRCVINNPNNVSTTCIDSGKNSAIELRETTIIGGVGSTAMEANRLGSFLLSKSVIIRKCTNALGFSYFGGRIISNADQGFNNLFLKDVSYCVRSVQNQCSIDLLGLSDDGNLVSNLNPSISADDIINREKGIRIYIQGATLEEFVNFDKDVSINGDLRVSDIYAEKIFGKDSSISINDKLKYTSSFNSFSGLEIPDASYLNWKLDSSLSSVDSSINYILNTKIDTVSIAVSDEFTNLEASTGLATFRMPFAMELTNIKASVTTAPTGSNLIVDVNQDGSTLLSTKLSIDSSENTSVTAATPVVIGDSSLGYDSEITIDIDQVGSTIPGTGLKVYLLGKIK